MNDKFNKFFLEIYGDRWEKLKSSLLTEVPKILRPTQESQDFANFDSYLESGEFLSENNRSKLEEAKDNKKFYYALDPVSVYAASLLKIPQEAKVLDMCSAPGGKGLILRSQMINGEELTLNEPSKNRRERLKKVFREHLKEEDLDIVTMKGLDGIKYGIQFPEYFDAILVDAPCSGEKHLLETPSELEKWSEKRTKRLASQQYGLLCSALLALKPGGSLVYSTCSISPHENDGVIEKLLKKKSDQFELDLPEDIPSIMEKTVHGLIGLPDKGGYGPIFVTRLRKK